MDTAAQNIPQQHHSISVWAKQQASPFWPSRILCADEVKHIERHKPQARGNKLEYVGVYFYGTRQSGWVTATQIFPFDDPTAESRIHDKKLLKDVHYQRGMIEATRLLLASGSRTPKLSAKLEIPEEELSGAEEFCAICKGTDDSGELVRCVTEGCGTICHAHCMDPPKFPTNSLRKNWSCPKCVAKTDSEKQRKAVAEVKQRLYSNGGDKSYPTHVLLENVSSSEGSHQAAADKDTIIRDLLSQTQKIQDALKRSESKGTVEAHALEEMASKLADAERLLGQSPSKKRRTESSEQEDESSEDICFVCGLSNGPVIICDFPSCERVYHQACVCKTVPDPLGSEHLHAGDDEAWFCPVHFCTMCTKLEDPGVSLSAINPPSFLQQTTNLELVALQKCEGCPFSVCSDCAHEMVGENAMSDQHGLFGTKPGKKRACRNCCSNDPKLRLSRLLERCWARMATGRLAIPFMRPCLPLPSKTNQSPDLLMLVDNIRKCEYTSVASFRSDLQAFRQGCEAILREEGLLVQSAMRGIEGPAQIIMESLDTIVGLADAFLDRHAGYLKYLEQRCRGRRSTTPDPMQDTLGESDLSDEEEEEAGSDSANVTELDVEARRYWRKECEQPILTQNTSYFVTPRTIAGWAEFLGEGPPLPRTAHMYVEPTARRTVRRLLAQSLDVEDTINQEVAAGMMMSLKYATTSGGDWRATNSQLNTMLQDLENATNHVYQIQNDIKQNVHRLQRELVDTSAGSITIGEAHVLRELQLSNESLRVRLRRKDAAIALLKDTIKRIQTPESEATQRLLEERNKFKDENERLKRRLRQIAAFVDNEPHAQVESCEPPAPVSFPPSPSPPPPPLKLAVNDEVVEEDTEPSKDPIKRKAAAVDQLESPAQRFKVDPVTFC